MTAGSRVTFLINSQTDGLGVWSTSLVSPPLPTTNFLILFLIQVQNAPAVFYSNSIDIFFSLNSSSDGLGTWNQILIQSVPGPELGLSDIFGMIVDGRPAAVYALNNSGPVRFAISTDFIGTGWIMSDITSVVGNYSFPSMTIIDGRPAVAFYAQISTPPGDYRIIYAINSLTDGSGVWTITDIPYSAYSDILYSTDGRIQLLNVDNHPMIIYQADLGGSPTSYAISYTINSMVDGSGAWSAPIILQLLHNYISPVLRAIVKDSTIPIYGVNVSSSKYVFTYGIFHQVLPTQIDDVRLISAIDVATDTVSVATPFSAPIEVSFNSQYDYDILTWGKDNYNQLNYVGIYPNQVVCYDIELERLTLPNLTLASGVGNRIAFYPYIYVEFEILNNENQHTLTSNNRNSINALFSVPIYNVTTPASAAFVVLNGLGMKQTVKFNVGCNYRFKVKLSNGELFTTQQIDTIPPNPPNFNLQVSAVLGLTRRPNSK
jgi:hypothetical protein